MNPSLIPTDQENSTEENKTMTTNPTAPTKQIVVNHKLLMASIWFASAASVMAQGAGGGEIKWSEALSSSDNVSVWIRKGIVIIMSIFIMVALILGSLAFKQLAADGNWKDFWSKIAGAIGMFVVPVAVYWFVK